MRTIAGLGETGYPFGASVIGEPLQLLADELAQVQAVVSRNGEPARP